MNVLITDDEESARIAIRYLANFEEYGIEKVFEASNGRYAKQILQDNPIDLLLTDICMPMQDGISLMKWVREKYPNIKIIVISGHQNFDYALQAIRNEAMDYLLKPIDPNRLNTLIQNAIYQVKESQSRNSELTDAEVKGSDQNFEMLKDYILKNYTEPISLDEIADRFGFNASYISRRFKQKFGIGVTGYVTELRINKAKEMLIATDYKIYEIARLLGYSDEKYFSRVFSKSVGISPSGFRKIKR